MRIGIELGLIVPGDCGGIVPLLQGVLKSLFADNPDCRFDLLCTRANAKLFPEPPPNVHLDVLGEGGHDYFTRLERVVAERPMDVLFRSYPLDVFLPFPTSRQVVLIPDMQHEFFPGFFDPQTLQKRRESFDRAMAESGAIGTLSEHARGTILAHPALRCRDVFLMPPALTVPSPHPVPLTHAERVALPAGDFFLVPGNLWAHKNHSRVFRAFRQFCERTTRPAELILTGHPQGWEEMEEGECVGLPVRHLGFVRRSFLQELMRRARALVFFSLYEGFGMPLLEAFHAGTPVVCSDTTSLPEVGGDAVLACDPTDVGGMADALERVHSDAALRERLAAAGKGRLPHYGWQSSAANLLAACRRVAATPRSPVAVRPPASAPPGLWWSLRHRVKPWLPRGVARVARAVLHPRTFKARLTSKVRSALTPTLGIHHQYPPRPMATLPPSRRILRGAAPSMSIVTPSFNQAAFLERTMRSVLDQEYPALEYIVQDGGSTDATPALLERYRDRLSHCESRPDGGQAEAINLGFRHATGELLAYLNSDDLVLPGSLAYVAHYFKTHPDVDVIYGHRVIIDQDDQEVGRWVLPPHDDVVLSWNDYVPQETLFWRKRIWDRVGGIDETFQFALDWDLLLRFRDAGARIVRVPRFLGAFRVHPQQKTSARMADLGYPEIDRLRERSLGRPVTEQEVQEFVQPYLRRHAWYQLMHRAGLLY